MASEKVNLSVDTDGDTTGITRVRRELLKLVAESKAADAAMKKLGLTGTDVEDALNNAGKAASKSSNSFDDVGDASQRTSKKLSTFDKAVKGLSKFLSKTFTLALKGAGIETLALAGALSLVNGLLITGRFLVKAYNVAMSGLAKGAAVAVAALATVAAAQRQFAAASSAGRYGGSFSASSASLRGMTGDARLATVGMKGLTQAFAAASKNAKVTGATGSAIAGLLDFAYLSGDVEKGTTALANLISLIQKGEGISSSKVTAAAKDLGPEFEKAYKEIISGGKMTSEELIKMFSSGEFAKKAGVGGTASAVQGSLMGQLKAFMTNMQVMFGDFGQQFIEPVQRAFEQIRRIMVRTFTQITPLVNDYVQGGLLDKFVNGIDKISQFLVKLMGEYVPQSSGFFSKFASFFDRIKEGFNAFNAYLRRFSEASKIVNKFFGGILGAIGKGLKTNFEAFGENVVKNKDNFLEFGDSIERLITKIFELFRKMRDAFMRALPSIEKIVNAITYLVDKMGDLISMLSGLPGMGGFGGLAALFGPLLLSKGLGTKTGRNLMKGAGRGLARTILKNPGTSALLGGAAAAQFLPGPDIINDVLSAGLLGGGVSKMLGAGPMSTMRAGGAAAVGTLAYQASGQLSDLVYRKTGGNRLAATATGVGVGAAGGAAAGAMLGSAIPGLGTAVGAVAGAIIGGIVGGVKGFLQDSKYKNLAKKNARKFVEEYSGLVNDAIGGNNLDAAKKALDDFSGYAKEFANTQFKSGTALKEANKQWEETLKTLEPQVKLMDARFKDLNDITGLTNEQIAELANTAEISLGNGLLSLQDILEATGVATRRFGDDFSKALEGTYAEAVSNIRRSLDILRAPNVANEAAKTFREKALAGTVTAEDTAALLEALSQEQLLASGGDPLKAFQTLFGNIGTPGGKQFTTFEPGKGQFGVLSDMAVVDAIFNNPESKFVFDQFFGQMATGTSQLGAQNLASMLAGQGYSAGSVEQITAQLDAMFKTNPTMYFDTINKLQSGELLSAQTTITPYGAMPGSTKSIPEQLKEIFPPEFYSNLELQKTNEQLLRDTLNDASLAFQAFNNPDSTFNTAVSEFKTAVDLLIDKFSDTASPRRNSVSALGAHGMFDAQIAGKRSVTSGYRNFALGSMNSDHAAGRAYDLVGQNLGLYGQAIRQAGGFAEFHGNGASRHLHVVPGGVPVGDTASPFVGTPIVGSTRTSNSTINVVVNASPGMDVQALADAVITRIDREQRSRNERY